MKFSIFRTPRIHRHRRDGVEAPTEGAGRRLWVLSRALCRYRVFPLLDDSSPSKRLAAIDLKVSEWSPYGETARVVHEDGKRAGVWIWDRQAVNAHIQAAGLRPERVTVLPETAMQPRGTDGLRHVKAFDGSEGQYWVNGLLVASRWWPEPPADAEWIRFQRAAGVPPEAALEHAGMPEQLVELPRPWVTGNTFRSGAAAQQRLLPAYGAMAAAAILLIGIYIGQSIGDGVALGQIDDDVAQGTAAAQPRAAERNEAHAALDAVSRLQALAPYPGQLELWVKVSDVLPRNGTKVTEWNFQTGQLDFTVSSPTPIEAPAYVKTLQSLPGFTNVTVDRVGGDKVLKVKLKVGS